MSPVFLRSINWCTLGCPSGKSPVCTLSSSETLLFFGLWVMLGFYHWHCFFLWFNKNWLLFCQHGNNKLQLIPKLENKNKWGKQNKSFVDSYHEERYEFEIFFIFIYFSYLAQFNVAFLQRSDPLSSSWSPGLETVLIR